MIPGALLHRETAQAWVDRYAAMTAAGWNESEHPRHPGGTEQGGEFASKNEGAAMYLKDGQVFKFAGADPGGLDSIQWFRAEQRENGLYAVEIDGDNVFPLSGVVDEVEVVAEVPGVDGPLEPVFAESGEESENSSSHKLYDVTIDGELWHAKKVEETQELQALRDHVEPGRDLERELAAKIMYEEIRNAAPDMLDLRVADVKEANIAGLGHVVMSKHVPETEDGEPYSQHAELSEGEARALSIYDWVLGNTDRHLGNIVRSDSGAWAIDQGLSFPAANRDSFGRFHVAEFYSPGQPEAISFPDGKGFAAIGGLQEDWERIDTRLRPYLNENERRAMWRRIEWVANGQGRLPTHSEWANGAVDEMVQGYGWHPSVTLGQDEEANVGEVYDSRSEDDRASDFEAGYYP